MRALILVAISVLVVGTTVVENVAVGAEPVGACSDDGCPSAGDHCGDCLHCAPAAVPPAVLAIVTPPTTPCASRVPCFPPVTASPPSAPSGEILTVPRA